MPQPLLVKVYRREMAVEKIKFQKFIFKVGKSVILCEFIENLTQIPDNDRFSRRIRGYFGRKGAFSSAGGLQKAIAGRGFAALCYQQGI